MKPEEIRLESWQQLNRAIRAGDQDQVASILDRHPELIFQPDLGSCLHLAAKLGNLPICALLLERGIDINLSYGLQGSALNEAAFRGHLDIVKFARSRGAILDSSSPDYNPLFSAIYAGHLDIVRYLLKAGIDANAVYLKVSGELKNALSFAQVLGKSEIVDILVAAGCQLPVEGIDQPIWGPDGPIGQQNERASAIDGDTSQIIGWLADLYGPVEALSVQELVAVDAEVHVAIHVIRPNLDNPNLTLFTTGMSDLQLNVPSGEEAHQYAELIMHLPADWPELLDSTNESAAWPLQWLRMIAYQAHLSKPWLGGQHIVITPTDPLVPLGRNTRQTCLLLIADFDAWSPLILEGGKTVHFYTVIPLYTEERDFEVQHGIVQLIQRLQERGCTTVVQVHRENVALPM